jgi:hypothetical protein
MIRVDGRLAAKPLGSAEQEREFPVGSTRWALRRSGDGFTLDPVSQEAPPAAAGPGNRTKTVPEEKKTWTTGKIIWLCVAIVVGLFMSRVAWVSAQYMRVPWQTYSPPDHSFTAIFPGDPKEETENLNLKGDIWTFHALHGTYRSHAYMLGYVDAHVVVVDANSDALIERFLGGVMSGDRMHLLSSQKTTFRRDHALDFMAEVPMTAERPSASVRGRIVLHGNRLYMIWVIVPRGQESAVDVEKFLKTFDVG